jgi:hypothetical protein
MFSHWQKMWLLAFFTLMVRASDEHLAVPEALAAPDYATGDSQWEGGDAHMPEILAAVDQNITSTTSNGVLIGLAIAGAVVLALFMLGLGFYMGITLKQSNFQNAQRMAQRSGAPTHQPSSSAPMQQHHHSTPSLSSSGSRAAPPPPMQQQLQHHHHPPPPQHRQASAAGAALAQYNPGSNISRSVRNQSLLLGSMVVSGDAATASPKQRQNNVNNKH